MGAGQPYLYSGDSYDAKLPAPEFDPKAVTRASYVPKPPRHRQDGPLVSFNRHPDAHMVPSYRTTKYTPMSHRSKSAIKWLRRIQLLLRILELNGAVGLLVLMILVINVDLLQGWIIRISAGVAALTCSYAVYHLSRSASGRTPASSAAYQLFAGVTDAAIMPLYAYGALSVTNFGSQWLTRLSNQDIMAVFRPTIYYLFIATGGLHFVSLGISAWLGWSFRRISLMPPDMNPLESHLTSRARHRKNKSSVATASTDDPSEKRLSTPLETRRRSGLPYENVSRPPVVPFLHTRNGSRETIGNRDSRMDLPSRQYQITPGNSPRNSGTSGDFKGMINSRFTYQGRGSYTELSLRDTESSRPSTATTFQPQSATRPRVAKFSENWTPSDSLISRTQERSRAKHAAENAAGERSIKSYEALSQRYNLQDSESDSENDRDSLAGSDVENEPDSNSHPNPLRSHPPAPPRARASFAPSSLTLTELSQNLRRPGEVSKAAEKRTGGPTRAQWHKRDRDSSIQPEADFFAKPYGELKAATPPIMIGGSRQVSSGNDLNPPYQSAYGRRNVSGKVAEEGRAGRKGTPFRYGAVEGQM